MKQNTRVALNIVSFGLLAVLLTGWALTNYVTFGLTEPESYEVTFTFPESPGLREGFDVAYLGVPIGSITDVTLNEDDVTVFADILDEYDVTASVSASIRRRSAVGEPFIDLAPLDTANLDGPPFLRETPTVPIENTRLPLSYEEVFGTVADLLGAIPADAVSTITHELAVALEGREDDLRTTVRNLESVSVTLGERAEVFDELAVQSADLSSFFAAESGQIAEVTRDVALLADTLRASRDDLLTLLDTAPDVAEQVADLLLDSRSGLECMLTTTERAIAVIDTPANGASLRAGLENKQDILELLIDVTHEREGGTYLRVNAFANNTDEDNRSGTRSTPPEAPALTTCPEFSYGGQDGVGAAAATSPDPAPLPRPTFNDDITDPGDRTLEEEPQAAPASTEREFPPTNIPVWVLLLPLALAAIIAWRPWARF